jgi:hypothetical protein
VRTAEKQRVEKLLEDAQVVAIDIFGVSGRDMMAALIGEQRDPRCSLNSPGLLFVQRAGPNRSDQR